MLTVGLLTEALIFIIYAFYHPHDPIEDLAKNLQGGVGGGSASPANDALKDLIEKEINPDNLKKLNENFAKFNTTVQNMSNVADLTSATHEYAAKTKEATAALGSVKMHMLLLQTQFSSSTLQLKVQKHSTNKFKNLQ